MIECDNLSDIVCASVLESKQDYKLFYFIISVAFWGFLVYWSKNKLEDKKMNIINKVYYQIVNFIGWTYILMIPFGLMVLRSVVDEEILFNYNLLFVLVAVGLLFIVGIMKYIDYTLKKYTGSSIFDEIKEKYNK